MTTPFKFLVGAAVVVAVGATAYALRSDDTVIIGGPTAHSSSSSSTAREMPTSVGNVSSQAVLEEEEHDHDGEQPTSVRIVLSFASQAPTGNWDPPYDEACEEASLIIVRHYLDGTPLNADIMNDDIQAMVAKETSMGLPVDIDMVQLATVAREMFGFTAEVVEGADVSIERIEQELANGNPVIVPLAGQDIGNPYYSGDGPPYHALVIIGYDANHFTTHDVGTKRGANYVYPKDVIMSAIHDWHGSVDTIRSGPRRMLIVTK